MTNYIDGFVFPIKRSHLEEYKKVAHEVAEIWKKHGALAYFEYLGDDMHLRGTKSFEDLIAAKEDEVVILGWVTFASKEDRDLANEKVPKDERMNEIVLPLMDPNRLIFDAKRMAYGGFNSLIP